MVAWAVIALGAVVGAAAASERSERLVARAQAASSAGRTAEAEDLFAAAIAADGQDVEARYGLGVTLASQRRWKDAEAELQRALALRPGDPATLRALDLARAQRTESATADTHATAAEATSQRMWSVRGHAGVGFDGNVPLLSHGTPGRRADAVFDLGAGLSVTPIARDDLRLQLDYDFDQTLHPRLRDFDLRSNRFAGTLSVALAPGLWASLNGGVDHYGLGTHQYLVDPFVQPFLSYDWTDVGTTQVYYRHGQPDYLSAPFEDVRSGQTNGTGVTQLLYLGDPARRLTVGYSFEDEDPRRSIGDDYQRASHGATIGLELPLWWQTTVDVAYGYRHDGYREPNSIAGFRKARTDDAHNYAVGLARPVFDGVTLRLDYQGTANTSNIGFFDYRRQVVFVMLEARY